MRSAHPLAPPRIESVVLQSLVEGEPRLLSLGADLDGLRFHGAAANAICVSGSAMIGCEFH